MGWYDPGKQVVCIKRGPWRNVLGEKTSGMHPRFREVCTVIAVEQWLGVAWLTLGGFPRQYEVTQFKPIEPAPNKADRGLTILKQIADGTRQPEEAEA